MNIDLPPAFVSRLIASLGETMAARVLPWLRDPRPIAWRVDRRRADPAEIHRLFEAQGISVRPGWNEASAWAPAEFREMITRHPVVARGEIYIQNLASQLASHLLAPQPGETVLDLAAAPGGKTLHMGELMNGEGELCAVEPIRSRFFRLRANLERFGATHVRLFMADGRTIGKKVPGKFDRVLLDAPCSGESRFRAGQPATYRTWSPRKVRECRRKQIGLIRSAFLALKPGGRLLYCTCSFSVEENEWVVAQLIKDFPDQVELLPIQWHGAPMVDGLTELAGDDLPPELKRTKRLLPDERNDGFYFALIGKNAFPRK